MHVVLSGSLETVMPYTDYAVISHGSSPPSKEPVRDPRLEKGRPQSEEAVLSPGGLF